MGCQMDASKENNENPVCKKCPEEHLSIGGRRHQRHYDYFFTCESCAFQWPEICGYDTPKELREQYDASSNGINQSAKPEALLTN